MHNNHYFKLRCTDCNINFSKYQNYVAHKKYYCSGVKQAEKKEEEEKQVDIYVDR